MRVGDKVRIRVSTPRFDDVATASPLFPNSSSYPRPSASLPRIPTPHHLPASSALPRSFLKLKNAHTRAPLVTRGPRSGVPRTDAVEGAGARAPRRVGSGERMQVSIV